jgi:hypothetical protein
MTREKFVEQYRHLMLGLLTHGIIAGKTGSVDLFLQIALEKADAVLAKCYDAAEAEARKPPANPQTRKETQK